MTNAERIIAAIFGAIGGILTACLILLRPPRVH